MNRTKCVQHQRGMQMLVKFLSLLIFRKKKDITNLSSQIARNQSRATCFEIYTLANASVMSKHVDLDWCFYFWNSMLFLSQEGNLSCKTMPTESKSIYDSIRWSYTPIFIDILWIKEKYGSKRTVVLMRRRNERQRYRRMNEQIDWREGNIKSHLLSRNELCNLFLLFSLPNPTFMLTYFKTAYCITVVHDARSDGLKI